MHPRKFGVVLALCAACLFGGVATADDGGILGNGQFVNGSDYPIFVYRGECDPPWRVLPPGRATPPDEDWDFFWGVGPTLIKVYSGGTAYFDNDPWYPQAECTNSFLNIMVFEIDEADYPLHGVTPLPYPTSHGSYPEVEGHISIESMGGGGGGSSGGGGGPHGLP